jgi:HlyD family secretion protein
MTLKRPLQIALLGCVLLAGFMGFRVWQGPLVPAYQLKTIDLTQNVVATGRIVSTSRVQVNTEIAGVVLERRVKEGDRVNAGDVLIVLRADDLAAKAQEAQASLEQLQRARRPLALAALRQAEAQFAQTQREVKRRRDLFKADSISREVREQAENQENTAKEALEQARLLVASLEPGASEENVLRERLAAARALLEKTTIRAQVAGTILTRNVEPGDAVQPVGKALLEIARAGDTEILIPLDERNIGNITIGQVGVCIADAYPNRPFKARVNFISPTVDPQRGTVDIRLKIEPVPEGLKHDMTLSVDIVTAERSNTLVIPNDALLAVTGSQAQVFTVQGGKVVRTTVELGLKGLALTEIKQGLKADDWVLLTPSAKEGTRVRLAPQPIPAHTQGLSSRKETPVKFN